MSVENVAKEVNSKKSLKRFLYKILPFQENFFLSPHKYKAWFTTVTLKQMCIRDRCRSAVGNPAPGSASAPIDKV